MKKLITLVLIISTTAIIQAQSNLVFNQALIVEINSSTEQIIPEGKVWKVESFSNYDVENILVNDSEWAIGNPIDFRNMPIWFPAGTILKRDGAGSQKDYLSVLEFNVVAISSSSGGSGGGVSADGFTASGIINLAFSGTNSSGNIGTKTVLGTIAVPEGKIWKIVSSSFGNSSNPDTVYLGNGYNGDIFVDDFIVSGEDKPVYLSAGTYEVAGKTAASGGGGIYYILGKIGGIEYNAN